MIQLLASVSPGELRAVAWDGRLVDLAVSRSGDTLGMDSLHRGRVIAVVPAMAGAFVALDRVDGFLPDSEMGARKARLSVGTMLGVRVTRAAQGGKGPRLSARLSPGQEARIGAGSPALVDDAPDALARLMALYPHAPVRIDDAGRAALIGRSAAIVTQAFDDAVEQELASLEAPYSSLPGAARMSIHPTPALVAIDVDLGGQTAQRASKASAQAEGNQRLIPELCRQIRLRNLSGAIVVDLAGMTPRRRLALAPDFTHALAQDRLTPKFLGFSALGLAEILRPRLHPPLHEFLAGPLAAGLAALRNLTREIAAQPHTNPSLRCSPAVATALRQDEAARMALAQTTGRPLTLIEDRALIDTAWRLEIPPRG